MVLVRGEVRGEIHMLFILSPIVSAGGLIEVALTPVVFILTQLHNRVNHSNF